MSDNNPPKHYTITKEEAWELREINQAISSFDDDVESAVRAAVSAVSKLRDEKMAEHRDWWKRMSEKYGFDNHKAHVLKISDCAVYETENDDEEPGDSSIGSGRASCH